MTKQKWVAQVETHRTVLKQFVMVWHPNANNADLRSKFKITASAAEEISEWIRDSIRMENSTVPISDFDRAIEQQDVKTIFNILEAAWFGVPESTDCWSITGFKEAVDLLDDPPEE